MVGSVDCPFVSVRQSEVFKWQRYLRPSPSLLGAINAKSPCGRLFFKDRRQLGVLPPAAKNSLSGHETSRGLGPIRSFVSRQTRVAATSV